MIKIGVIGVGGMGSAHCQALKDVKGSEFTGVWDISGEAAARAAEKFSVRAFPTSSGLLEQVDAVVVATPGFVHTQPVVEAARAGVHVFVEKPMAAALEECDRMIAACRDGGVILQVGMVLRFYPVHQLGMKLVRDGTIGDLVYIETDYSGRYNAPRKRPENWYGKMGGLLENGIHKADLLNWFGGRPRTVCAEVGSFSGHDDWEDYAASLVRYLTGTVGILRWGGFLGARGSTDTYLDGTLGSLRLSMQSQTAYRKLVGESDWTELVPENQKANGVVAELQHFVDCIRDGRTPLIDGHGGRAAVELVMACYESGRKGVKVSLPN
ncbi:MAG: Gfo/Idh/MocA family oxidoreductase [Planctomycetes bacterium]|nr:Gfo/Idh/MocA family oxidoreductase [Planctomycetota bacterium]